MHILCLGGVNADLVAGAWRSNECRFSGCGRGGVNADLLAGGEVNADFVVVGRGNGRVQ